MPSGPYGTNGSGQRRHALLWLPYGVLARLRDSIWPALDSPKVSDLTPELFLSFVKLECQKW